MRSSDFPFAVMPQRFDKGGPSFADRARTVAKGATFAFNDEIEAGLRALAKLDPAAYQREVARIRAQQAAYEEANPYESAGLEIGGAMLPALLPGGQGLAAARVAALAGKAPRLARIAPAIGGAVPVLGEAALYGVGAADSMADIPSSVVSEGAQALGMYGVGAAAAPRLKALGSKLAARLRPSKGTAPSAMAVKPQALPAPEAPLAVAQRAKTVAPENSEVSRMARADEQNYMSDRFWHGRDAPSQYEPNDTITFYSRDPEYAAGFARDGGSVYEYRIRPQKMMPAGKVNFGTAADIIEGLIKAEDESGAVRVMSGLVDFPGTPQQFVAAARRAPENSLGVSAAAIQHLLSKNANTTWESALRSAGFDAYDTGRDVVMLTRKGQRRVDAAFDPEQIEATGVTKARGGLAVFKDKTPFAVRG